MADGQMLKGDAVTACKVRAKLAQSTCSLPSCIQECNTLQKAHFLALVRARLARGPSVALYQRSVGIPSVYVALPRDLSRTDNK